MPALTRDAWAQSLVAPMRSRIFTLAGIKLPLKKIRVVFEQPPNYKLVSYTESTGTGHTIRLAPSVEHPRDVMQCVFHELLFIASGGYGPTFKDNMQKLGIFQGRQNTARLPKGPWLNVANDIVDQLPRLPANLKAFSKPNEMTWFHSTMIDGYKVQVSKTLVRRYGLPRDPRGVMMVPERPADVFE